MNDALSNPHDKFVKEILSDKENARDFFFHYLPAQVRALVDLNSLEICKDSFVDDELSEYFSDLLYQLKLAGPGKNPGFLYLLFEHKSYRDRWIALHLLNYQVKIWELYLKQNKKTKTLPVVIPMVLYHGRREWKVGLRFSDLISASDEELRIYIPNFSYLLHDLSAYSDDQIRGIVIIRAFLMALKYMQHPECADHLEEIFFLLKDTLSQPGRGLSFFESLIRYIFNTTDRVRVDELKEMVEKTITKDKEEIIMTLAEKLIQQGMQQGMQQGVQEGEIKMAKKAVLDILETRFQEVPASLKVKLEGISDRAFLEDLLRQAVTVTSLDELEKKIPLGNLS